MLLPLYFRFNLIFSIKKQVFVHEKYTDEDLEKIPFSLADIYSRMSSTKFDFWMNFSGSCYMHIYF